MARISTLSSLALALGVAACSWARFDDVSENAPVLLFTKPSNVSYGFGSSVASGEADGFYRVFVGAGPGRTGGAEFEIGPKQGASKDAVRSGHCGVGCTLAKTAASLRRATLEAKDRTLCVAEGLGTGEGQKPLGIQIQCAGEPAVAPCEFLGGDREQAGAPERGHLRHFEHREPEPLRLLQHLPQRRFGRDDFLGRHAVEFRGERAHDLRGKAMCVVLDGAFGVGQRFFQTGQRQFDEVGRHGACSDVCSLSHVSGRGLG